MTNDLDALLTALYVEIDDHVVPARRGRGRRPRLSDAELLTLAAAQVLLGIDTEARWIRFAYCRLGHLFRYLPKQPGYHKRLVAAAPLLAAAITHLARISPSWCDDLRLIDATPLPCGTSRATAKRSDLAGYAGYGYCAAHSRFYWGFKLYLLAAPDGMPIAWCLAHPKTGEREVCLDLLTIAVETGRLAAGSTVLADKGLAGREIETQIAALGVTMLRPDRRTEPVGRVLARHEVPHLAAIDPITGEPVRRRHSGIRYEHPRPGDLLHIDVKKLGRVPDGGGWRLHGRKEEVRGRGNGYDYLHVAVDDHSRVAYIEALTDERDATCAGFLYRAVTWFREHGVRVLRILTDNAKVYRVGSTWRAVCVALGIRRRFTKPGCPWTNGKAERLNRTLLAEFAYARPWLSNTDRLAALDSWVTRYNTRRAHSAIGGRLPITRLAA